MGKFMCTHEQACMRRQDYVYVSSFPKNPKNTTNAIKLQNEKSNNLTCF